MIHIHPEKTLHLCLNNINKSAQSKLPKNNSKQLKHPSTDRLLLRKANEI